MLIGYEGGLGSGKTIGVLRNLKKDKALGHPICSNFDIFEIEYNELNLDELLDKEHNEIELNNISIGIDEITVYCDCRLSTSHQNRLFSYFILQSRKRNVNIYYSTQAFSLIDLRLYNFTLIRVLCEKLFAIEFPDLAYTYGIDKDDDSILDIRKFTFFDIRNRKNIKVIEKIINISKYYEYYDTNQRILPISKK